MGNCNCGDGISEEREDLTDEFTVTATKEPGAPLGLTLDFMDSNTARVVEVQSECRVQVRVGDHIVAVNGKRGREEIMPRLQQDRELELSVMRPTAFRIRVTKGDGLGVELAPSGEGLKVLIILGTGAIHDWNEAHPSAMVRPNDRIVKVNRTSGKGSDLLNAIKSADNLALVICPAPKIKATNSQTKAHAGAESGLTDGANAAQQEAEEEPAAAQAARVV
mmetsp:Transcript_96862/g.312785  ORF Transcript_96862/g.312785 Transcript_96862/m.312785 type:complete len:221 (+) Transcript_96862:1-663(+)